MKKVIILVLLLAYNISYGQNEYLHNNIASTKLIRTSIIIQDWGIDGIENHISEGTLPIEIIYPINRKFNLNIYNSPAISRFGNKNINGLSDTWIRCLYNYSNNIIFSCGAGIPTGTSQLTKEEYALANIINLNMFKFQVPIYGQGFTLSNGVITAYPINEKFVIGGGLNYVFRGKFKYCENLNHEFNPGDNIGLNLGLDYYHSDKINLNLDLLFTYYTNDKLNDTNIFGAATKKVIKFGFNYFTQKHLIWAIVRYRLSGKNEIWDGTTLITEPQNTNITERELNAIYQMNLSSYYAINFLVDLRSYVENDYGAGQADIFGGGIGNIIQILPNFKINVLFKFFIGDGYYNGTVNTFTGSEFRIISEYIF